MVDEIDAHLHLLKVHLPYHESDHVLNITYNVLVGGQRLEDIEYQRQDATFLNALDAARLPDPTTAGDFTRRFDEDGISTLMDCINRSRTKLWNTRGRDLLREEALIDIDGTLAPTTGWHKQRNRSLLQRCLGIPPLGCLVSQYHEAKRAGRDRVEVGGQAAV